MSGLGIRIAPPDTPQPLATLKPLEDAQRWDSPFEDDGITPGISVFMNRAAYIRVTVHACSDFSGSGRRARRSMVHGRRDR